MGVGELLGIRLTRRTGIVRRMGARGIRGSTAESQVVTRRDVEERRMGGQRGGIGRTIEGGVIVGALGSLKLEKERKRGWEWRKKERMVGLRLVGDEGVGADKPI